MISRRSLLTGFGAGAVTLTGCLETGSSVTDSQTSSNPVTTTDQFQNRDVKLAGIEQEPQEYNIGVDGEMSVPEVTENHTATIRLIFTNEGDSESIDIAGIRHDIPVIAEDFTYSVPQEYLLVPPRYEQPDRKDTCWEVPHENAFNGSNAGGESLYLSPGESVSQQYLLWDRKPTTPCMPIGDYHFGSKWANEGQPFKWMITLTIEELE